jgi:hypothetical protein
MQSYRLSPERRRTRVAWMQRPVLGETVPAAAAAAASPPPPRGARGRGRGRGRVQPQVRTKRHALSALTTSTRRQRTKTRKGTAGRTSLMNISNISHVSHRRSGGTAESPRSPTLEDLSQGTFLTASQDLSASSSSPPPRKARARRQRMSPSSRSPPMAYLDGDDLLTASSLLDPLGASNNDKRGSGAGPRARRANKPNFAKSLGRPLW